MIIREVARSRFLLRLEILSGSRFLFCTSRPPPDPARFRNKSLLLNPTSPRSCVRAPQKSWPFLRPRFPFLVPPLPSDRAIPHASAKLQKHKIPPHSSPHPCLRNPRR